MNKQFIVTLLASTMLAGALGIAVASYAHVYAQAYLQKQLEVGAVVLPQDLKVDERAGYTQAPQVYVEQPTINGNDLNYVKELN